MPFPKTGAAVLLPMAPRTATLPSATAAAAVTNLALAATSVLETALVAVVTVKVALLPVVPVASKSYHFLYCKAMSDISQLR